MTSKRAAFVLVLAAAAVLAACGGQTEHAQQPAATVPAADPAAVMAPPAETTSAAALPKPCADYLARAEACVSKANGAQAVEAFRQSLAQSRAQWNQMAANQDALIAACQQADAQFAQVAMSMKCE